MKNKILLIVLVVALAAMSLVSACKTEVTTEVKPTQAVTTEVKPIQLVWADGYGASAFQGDMHEKWAKELEQRTGGRVKITLYRGATLIPIAETYSGVAKGMADIGSSIVGYTPGAHPLVEFLDQPVGSNSCYVMNSVLRDLNKDFKPEELSDVHVLWLATCSLAHLFTNVPTHSLEDFKGQEIRASGVIVGVVSALGGVPVGTPITEAYEALSKGIVDGIMTSSGPLSDFRLAEVLHYIIPLGLCHPTTFGVMNLNTWNSLPPDIQKVFDEMSGDEWLTSLADAWEKSDKDIIAWAVSKYGCEVTTLPPEELARWKAIAAQVGEKYAADLEAKGVKDAKPWVDEAYKLVEKYNKE